MILPGTLLGRGEAGQGCYVRNEKVYASRRGELVQEGNVFSIHAPPKISVGMKAFGRILKITLKQATVQIISYEGIIADVQATLLHKDTIVQYEKHEMRHLVRPMDIVQVKIISTIPLLCSMVDEDCGVVVAESNNKRLVPVSWTEMKSFDGEIIKRKVAKRTA
jgi:exosome complex RNA-binding protein Csl4